MKPGSIISPSAEHASITVTSSRFILILYRSCIAPYCVKWSSIFFALKHRALIGSSPAVDRKCRMSLWRRLKAWTHLLDGGTSIPESSRTRSFILTLVHGCPS